MSITQLGLFTPEFNLSAISNQAETQTHQLSGHKGIILIIPNLVKQVDTVFITTLLPCSSLDIYF